jgi:hypothetical protein
LLGKLLRFQRWCFVKRNAILIAMSFLTSSACVAQAPSATPVGPAAEVQAAYNRVKQGVLKAVEKMPEADFQYRPTADIRTFARIVNHVTEAQFHTCSALNGTAVDPNSVRAILRIRRP